MDELTDKQLLLRTADVMETRGWVSGQLLDSRGHVCLMGAMNIALGESPFASDAYHHAVVPLLVDKLSLPLRYDPYHTAIMWNNAQTSGQPVIDGLRRVAASLP